jgi:hypothetical protein
MTARTPRLEVLTELLLALLGVHVLILAVFRRYELSDIGLPLSVRDPTPALVLGLLLLGFRAWRNRHRAARRLGWVARLKPGNWFHSLGAPGFILACCFVFVFHLFHHYGGRLGGDGVMNYIYVRSLVIDGDFNLTNEFEEFVPNKFQYIAEEARQLGKPPDPSNEPGPAFFWAPAFIVTHGLVKALNWLGADIPADGYSYPYINAVCLSGFLWGFVAVVIAYRVCRNYFEPRLAAVAVSALWLSSTFYWYTVVEPSMPHATAAAAVSFFLYLWLKVRESPSTWRWIGLALAGGLILSMQRYNVFFFLAPLTTATGGLIKSIRSRGLAISRRRVATLVAVGGAVLLTALPMLLYNFYYSREGSFLRMGDLGGFTLRYWKDPRIGEFLFSSNHGLFSWTPAAYLAVLGLFLFLRKDGRLAATLILTLAGGVYLLSSTWDWYAGYAFGSRRMTEAFLILALGFCAMVEFLMRRPRLLAAGGLSLLVIWNLLLAKEVRRGEVPQMGTFAFSDSASRAADHFYQAVGHPPSFPAPWFFASRYGVSPEQFDPTYGHRPYHNLTINVGSPGDRYFLGQGWSIPEMLPDGRSYRWSVGGQSTWLVPLFGPFDYRLSFTGEPSHHPDGLTQTLAVEVNGHAATRITLSEGWQSVDARIPAAFWSEGLNEIRLVYGWTVEAGSVYRGSDPRQIAYRLERLRLQIIK